MFLIYITGKNVHYLHLQTLCNVKYDGVLQENIEVQTIRSFSTNTQFERKQLIRTYFMFFSNQEIF